MTPPLLSTISLVTELLISAAVIYTFYVGYKKKLFPTKLVVVALLYEIIFNISYMANRSKSSVDKKVVDFTVSLAIVHGILSLVMFISLIIFMILAWNGYRKGDNYFKKHKVLTVLFLIFWTISVLSGILFYFLKYII